MLKLEILCAGKLKEPFWRAAADEYAKRLGPTLRLTIKEYPEGKTLPIPGDKAFTVALCIEGVMMDSGRWAGVFWNWVDKGHSSLRFLIGGSDGLFDADKEAADFKLSLSPMTFPHHMARVLLLEQIYRAATIRENKAYHK